jgi:RCC1 and BTB domain-containing protein
MSIHVWGSNKYKQLLGQENLHCYAPAAGNEVLESNILIKIAAGDGHSLVLCESGDVYSFGRGNEGQLGHSKESKLESVVKLVSGLEHETIVDISAGSLTSYAITSTGKVYQWYN